MTRDSPMVVLLNVCPLFSAVSIACACLTKFSVAVDIGVYFHGFVALLWIEYVPQKNHSLV